jgi:hypothetical protein
MKNISLIVQIFCIVASINIYADDVSDIWQEISKPLSNPNEPRDWTHFVEVYYRSTDQLDKFPEKYHKNKYGSGQKPSINSVLVGERAKNTPEEYKNIFQYECLHWFFTNIFQNNISEGAWKQLNSLFGNDPRKLLINIQNLFKDAYDVLYLSKPLNTFGIRELLSPHPKGTYTVRINMKNIQGDVTGNFVISIKMDDFIHNYDLRFINSTYTLPLENDLVFSKIKDVMNTLQTRLRLSQLSPIFDDNFYSFYTTFAPFRPAVLITLWKLLSKDGKETLTWNDFITNYYEYTKNQFPMNYHNAVRNYKDLGERDRYLEMITNKEEYKKAYQYESLYRIFRAVIGETMKKQDWGKLNILLGKNLTYDLPKQAELLLNDIFESFHPDHLTGLKDSIDGTYIVYPSKRIPGAFVISMAVNKQIQEWTVERLDDQTYILSDFKKEGRFRTIKETVDHVRAMLELKQVIPLHNEEFFNFYMVHSPSGEAPKLDASNLLQSMWDNLPKVNGVTTWALFAPAYYRLINKFDQFPQEVHHVVYCMTKTTEKLNVLDPEKYERVHSYFALRNMFIAVVKDKMGRETMDFVTWEWLNSYLGKQPDQLLKKATTLLDDIYDIFHPGISGEQQIKSLLEMNVNDQDGRYLLRFSSLPGVFAVSFMYNQKLVHRRIAVNKDDFTLTDKDVKSVHTTIKDAINAAMKNNNVSTLKPVPDASFKYSYICQ